MSHHSGPDGTTSEEEGFRHHGCGAAPSVRLGLHARLSRPREERVRAAFYGRSNARGINGVHMLARQYEICHEAVAGRAVLVGFFYDLPDPVDEIIGLAVPGAGGPPRWDGGRDDLVAALGRADRGFDMIICSSLDRLSYRRDELGTWGLADRHQVAVTTAEDDLSDGLLPSLTQVGQGGKGTTAVDLRVAVRVRSSLTA
jgi:hypothetical protein